MQLIGQNPKAQQMVAAMQAHIADHVGFQYRQQIEQQLGMPLPPEEEKLPPQVEIALSGMLAQAAQQVLQQNQTQAAQAQAQQQAQDPVLQMQMKELEIRDREVGLKERKIQVDAALGADRLRLDERKIEGDQELAGLKVGAQIQESRTKQAAENEREGLRMGIDIAKSHQQARQGFNQNRNNT